MSKAILVIDMPKFDEETKIGCRNCRYADCGSIGFFESYKCVLTGQCKNIYEMKCPLKPIPQKKILDEELFMSGNFRLIQARFTGWNDCIDTLLGETE